MPLYLVHTSIFGLPTNIFEILTVLAMVFFFIKKRNNFIQNFLILPKFIFIAILLIIIGVLMSILFNNAYATGFAILKSWFLIPIIFSCLLYDTLNSERAVEKVFMSIYFSTAIIGLISIIYKVAGSVTYDNRLEAFYLSPNYLSMYLSPGIFFGCYFLIKSFQEKACSYKFFTNVVLLTFIFIPLYYTYSYGAWLAVFVSFLILLVLFANRKHLLAASAVVVITMLIFIFQTNSPRFSNLFAERSSLASRIMIWNASFLMIKQHPLLGVGPGNFQTAYLSLQKYFPPYLEWAVPQPHNLLLAFWIQAGILGLIGFVLLLFLLFAPYCLS